MLRNFESSIQYKVTLFKKSLIQFTLDINAAILNDRLRISIPTPTGTIIITREITVCKYGTTTVVSHDRENIHKLRGMNPKARTFDTATMMILKQITIQLT